MNDHPPIPSTLLKQLEAYRARFADGQKEIVRAIIDNCMMIVHQHQTTRDHDGLIENLKICRVCGSVLGSCRDPNYEHAYVCINSTRNMGDAPLGEPSGKSTAAVASPAKSFCIKCECELFGSEIPVDEQSRIFNAAVDLGDRLFEYIKVYSSGRASWDRYEVSKEIERVLEQMIRPYLAAREPVSVSLEKVSEAINGSWYAVTPRDMAKAVLNAAGVPYVD